MLVIQMPQAHSQEELRKRKVKKSQQLKPIPRQTVKRKRRKKRKPIPINRCRFESTEIGFLLKRYCIVEYNLIYSIAKENHIKINADIIERVSYASDNPFFKSNAYRLALLSFRVNGWVKRKVSSVYDDEMKIIVAKLKERGLG